jgi:hypothetical protein
VEPRRRRLGRALPSRAYLGGILWPKFDRAAARAHDPQAAMQLRRLEAVMNLAVFEDIRDISPTPGLGPAGASSPPGSPTRSTAATAPSSSPAAAARSSPAGSTYEKLGGSTPLSPETMWCIGWMNHDFTSCLNRKLSDAEIQKLVRGGRRRDRPGSAPPRTRGRTTTMSEDEDAALGTVRLLLGRHWDRAFVAWVNAQEDRRAAVTRRLQPGLSWRRHPDLRRRASLDIARWTENGPQLKPHQIAGACGSWTCAAA